jgi:hypothetical protein
MQYEGNVELDMNGYPRLLKHALAGRTDDLKTKGQTYPAIVLTKIIAGIVESAPTNLACPRHPPM